MNIIISKTQLILGYIIFYFTYIIVSLLIGFIAAIFGYVYLDFIEWVMLVGSICMIISLVLINKRISCIRNIRFYFINLSWTFFVLLIGIVIENTIGFETTNEYISDDNYVTIEHSSNIYYLIFTMFFQASTFSTLLLLITSIKTLKYKSIIVSIGTISILFVYLLLTA